MAKVAYAGMRATETFAFQAEERQVVFKVGRDMHDEQWYYWECPDGKIVGQFANKHLAMIAAVDAFRADGLTFPESQFLHTISFREGLNLYSGETAKCCTEPLPAYLQGASHA